jgi:hypothetical protein
MFYVVLLRLPENGMPALNPMALMLFYSVSKETGGPGSLLPNLRFDGPPRVER